MTAEVAANVNRERAAKGLGPLAVDGSRYSVVQAQAERNLTGACPSRACHSGNLPPGGGEVVYWGSGTPAGNATAWWMRSPGHRVLLLDSGATRMSVGVACGSGGTWATVVQLWAVNGAPRDDGSGSVTGGGSRCSAPPAPPTQPSPAAAPPPPPPPPTPTTQRPPSTTTLPSTTTTASTTTTLPPRPLTEDANRIVIDVTEPATPREPVLATEPASEANSVWPTTAVVAGVGLVALARAARMLRRRTRE
jgi:uncharacterized protein YkwD